MNLKFRFRQTEQIALASHPLRIRSTIRRQQLSMVLLAVFFLLPQAATAQMKEVRRVLIFNDLSTIASPGIALMDQAIHARLEESPYQIELYNESLETTLFSDEAAQRQIRDWYIRKYEHRQPDVIIAVGSASLKFMVESHEKYFPTIPIIFCGGTEEMLGESKPGSYFTGAWGVAEPEKTLNLALRLQPGVRHVVVTGGVGKFDRDVESIVRKSFSRYESSLDFTYLTDLAMPALLDRLRHLPSDTIVFHTSIMQDASGRRFIDATQSVPLVAAAATAPVFVLDDVDVGNGAVGGYVLSWAAQGREAAGMAVRVLNGESPGNIPVMETPNVNLFDWRALQRWRLSEKNLPPDSTLINRQSTVWESYKWYIAGVLSLIVLQALLIFEMLLLRTKRKKAETELIITNDRLRLALEGGGSVGWDWDIKTGRYRWFGDLQTMFGLSSGNYETRVEDFRQRIHPEDRELVARASAFARQNHQPYTAEFRVIRADGAVRWITARGRFYYDPEGEAVRMHGIGVDITERMQIEEARKKSDEKFSKAFRQSPMALTITTVKDSRYVEVNDTFVELTGWKRDEIIGRTPFELGLWTDPSVRVAMVDRLSTGGVVRNLEFKTCIRSGEIRAGLGSAELIEIDGELCVLSGATDVTDLKRAEATLRESEERFRLVANTAPVMIWMAGVDMLFNYFNRSWLEFTGRPLEAETGNGWTEGVHPEDRNQLKDTHTKFFERREPFQTEFRMRRRDGEYRWILDSGVPRFGADGIFAGFIGSAIDVTQHKLAEDALSMVSRKLIEAHEEERAWLARELHDDIAQRLTVLIMNLGQLRRNPQCSDAEFREGIGQAMQQAADLGTDMQALSHRLHSSKLEYLGLESAASSFCRELASLHNVDIKFHSETIPSTLPQDIALCVFRVLQEALLNALKHSGSRHFQVSLKGKPNALLLTVRDEGIGFDISEAPKGRGLGLISMKERMKLVAGKLRIDSQPGNGTTIHVEVPLVSEAMSARPGI